MRPPARPSCGSMRRAIAPRRGPPARASLDRVRLALCLLREAQQSQRAGPRLRGPRARRTGHLEHRYPRDPARPRRRWGTRVLGLGLRERQGADLRRSPRAAAGLRRTAVRGKSSRDFAAGGASAGGDEDLRTAEEDAGRVGAALDLRDPPLGRFLDPLAPVDAGLRSAGDRRSGLHSGRRPGIPLADVRPDVRRAPDGGTRAGRRISLRVLGGLPAILVRVLLRARGGVRVPIGSRRGYRRRRRPAPPPARLPAPSRRHDSLGAAAGAIPLERVRRALVHSVRPSGERGVRSRHRARLHGPLPTDLGAHLRLAVLSLARPLLLGALDGPRAPGPTLAAPLRPGPLPCRR